MVQGGQSGAVALNGAGDPVATLQTLVPGSSEARTAGAATSSAASAAGASTAVSSGTVPMDARAKARMQGYEGDPCGDCGNYTLVRNGTCMKCNTCGSTSGCS